LDLFRRHRVRGRKHEVGEDASLRVNCERRVITVSRPSSLSALMAGALKQAIFLVRRGRAEQAVNLSVQTVVK